MKRSLLLVAVLGFISGSALAAYDFHEAARYKLGGEGGWDYLTIEPQSHRLFIARSNRVMVVDTASGKLAGEVSGTDGVHGIAFDPKHGWGFTSNGKAGTVTVFDLKTLRPVRQLETGGQNPDAILYDPSSKKVLTFNGKSHDVSVIDPAGKSAVRHIALSGKPEFAVSDGKGSVFVNNEDGNAIIKLDVSKGQVAATYPLQPCESPTGLSMDRKSSRLFVGCGNSLVAVFDPTLGKVVQTFPAGQGIDATAFDAQRGLIFASSGDGQLTVIHEKSANEFEPLQKVLTQRGARTLAVDESSGSVFLVTADFAPASSPAPGQPKARPKALPDSFIVIVMKSR